MTDQQLNDQPKYPKYMKFAFEEQISRTRNEMIDLSKYLTTIEDHLHALESQAFEKFVANGRQLGYDDAYLEGIFDRNRNLWPEIRFAKLIARILRCAAL